MNTLKIIDLFKNRITITNVADFIEQATKDINSSEQTLPFRLDHQGKKEFDSKSDTTIALAEYGRDLLVKIGLAKNNNSLTWFIDTICSHYTHYQVFNHPCIQSITTDEKRESIKIRFIKQTPAFMINKGCVYENIKAFNLLVNIQPEMSTKVVSVDINIKGGITKHTHTGNYTLEQYFNDQHIKDANELAKSKGMHKNDYVSCEHFVGDDDAVRSHFRMDDSPMVYGRIHDPSQSCYRVYHHCVINGEVILYKMVNGGLIYNPVSTFWQHESIYHSVRKYAQAA